jgi:DNA-binding MarR family transcriptional regulator
MIRKFSKKTAVPPERIMVLMHRIVARAAETANGRFRRYGFNVQGGRVLVAILERGPMRVGELGKIVALDSSTLSHLLGRLCRLNLLVRSRLPDDNRAFMVSLTKTGRSTAAACKSISLSIEGTLLQGLSSRDTTSVRRFLGHICANAEWDPRA